MARFTEPKVGITIWSVYVPGFSQSDNAYLVTVLNTSKHPARDVKMTFRILLSNKDNFEELITVDLKDVKPGKSKALGNEELRDLLNQELKRLYITSLTERGAISNIRVHCIYKDMFGITHNDGEEGEFTELKIKYL